MPKDSLQLIAETLEFIEKNLTEKISVPDICAQIPLSAVQAQRLFRALVGDTMGSYLRIRRLSEAALMIKNQPQTRILDVAILFQFGSQETFARAFKTHFGVKPTEIPQHFSLMNLKRKPRLDGEKLLALKALLQTSAKMVSFSSRRFIGLKSQILSPLDPESNCFGVVPDLWSDFFNRRREIKPRKSSLNIGVGMTQTGSMLEEKLNYLACHEVDLGVEVPTGMMALEIGPATYAEFGLSGTAKDIHTAIDYIYGIWLPASGHQRAQGFDFEIIDPSFDLNSADSKITYYLPIA